MTKRIISMLAVAGALLGAPPGARADTSILTQAFCTATAFQVCVNFGLEQIGNTSSKTYHLTMTYVSTDAPVGQQGYMSKLALYDLAGNPNWSFSNLSVFSQPNDGQSWDISSCQGMPGDGVGKKLFEVCSREDEGPVKGLKVGQSVTLSFTSNPLIYASDFTTTGGLGLRSHVQSFGPNGCSLKPDARSEGNVVGGAASVNEECGFGSPPPPPPTTVPEPVSMALLGSGLVGIGALRRRRRGGDDA